MPIFLVTSALFAALALFFAADAALISFDLLPFFPGIRWLRIHPITLGVVTEAAFGLLPTLVASRAGRPRPKASLTQWLLLTIGILVLLAGIPLVDQTLILAGGTLVFLAAALLTMQLWQLRPEAGTAAAADSAEGSGRPFYVSSLLYLLVGIVVGTGMWIGWGPILRIKIPLEVHIHANNWGFASLLFAGLLVDFYPKITGKPWRWPGSSRWILWGMNLGALGLVFGPWFGNKPLIVAGILFHMAATFTLLANIILPLRGEALARKPGVAMLVGSYLWILLPVMMAPLVLNDVAGLAAAGIEANAPQALIYGWVLQFAFAMVPFLFRKAMVDGDPTTATLGGSWWGFAALNIGAILLWASIFAGDMAGLVHGAAYALWAIAALLFLWELMGVMRRDMLL